MKIHASPAIKKVIEIGMITLKVALFMIFHMMCIAIVTNKFNGKITTDYQVYL